MLNVARLVGHTMVEGPGCRAVIWLQGCLKRCPGCCNGEYLEMRPATMKSDSAVIDWLLEMKSTHQIEGVTLLGGEPLLQSQGLSVVAEWCQQNGLSVMLFTGYSEAEIAVLEIPYMHALIQQCDVIVAGPYDRTQPERLRNWAGSSNQTFIYLSERYSSAIETDPIDHPAIEFVLSGDVVGVHGYPLARLKTSRK